MSTETLAQGPGLAPITGKSHALGITAFVFAVVLAVATDVITGLVNTAPFLGQASPIGFTLIGIQGVAMVLPFVLGLIAAITSRGPGWGIAAIATSVAGNSMLPVILGSAVTSLVLAITGQSL